MTQVRDGKVESVEIDNTNGAHHRHARRRRRVQHHRPARRRHPGRRPRAVLREQGVRGRLHDARARGLLVSLLPFLIPVAIFVAFFWFMQRRAQSQMGGIMSIGRSRAKTYSTERPGHDVRRRGRLRRREAGHQGGRRLPQDAGALRARSAPASRRACCWSARRAPARRSSPARSPVRPACRSCRSPAPTSWRCSSASAPAACATSSQTRPEDGPGDHLRRRDRLDRPQARRRPGRRARRAGADAQPDALRDGRLRGHRGHRDDGGHQPARHPRPRARCARVGSTARSSCRCPS